MRILVSADMEGATGVTCPQDVRPGSEQWQRFRRMLTSDTNAAITGFFAAGADEVLVNEAHSTMRNLLLEELDPRAALLTGRHKSLGMMEGVLDADAVAFVGYHAGGGQPGVLAHTYLSTGLLQLRINGEPASEGRLNALLAAEAGVPVVLVTGDDLTCEEAAVWAPHARSVAVKTCVTRYAAVCLPPVRTAELIRVAAAESLEAAGRPQSVPRGPWRFELEFDATQLADACTAVPTVTATGPRTVAFTSERMYDGMRCFRALTQVAAAAREPDFD
ncbi:M55 family metallopeptidase [Peterkaempfera bronchialis]|uniref:Peptide ABC transporter substrate-binding protein n=1 Tax=Peterkaempfera bronchialis TaxID=2126346 RepID=A0A345T3D9_9ACTN|nr:M55 family metallopeptidase [Peterkaempfera bronchialis]AXI80494.1 peptide ABC transporter substrate-binding protein [Peterkaempfera bronchialis]